LSCQKTKRYVNLPLLCHYEAFIRQHRLLGIDHQNKQHLESACPAQTKASSSSLQSWKSLLSRGKAEERGLLPARPKHPVSSESLPTPLSSNHQPTSQLTSTSINLLLTTSVLLLSHLTLSIWQASIRIILQLDWAD
jgi:hypothetical protein